MRYEYFKVTRATKKFDSTTKSFHINISYKTAAATTPRALAVSEAFGLGTDDTRNHVLYDNLDLQICLNDVVYITGESGSGKSVLLKRLEKLLNPETINIQDVKCNASKPIIETMGETFEEALSLLCKVGLNDAFLFLRTYMQLSEGQKYRYRIAKLMESHKQYWIMDEFCSTLDRDTAKIVAFNVQKLARQEKRTVLVATTHTDLMDDLSPTLYVHKRFGKEIRTVTFPDQPKARCTIAEHVEIRQGVIEDYHKLSQFHYREPRWLPPPRKIFTMHRTDIDELVGIIVYSYPSPTCFGRKETALGKRLKIEELNEQLSVISRVVLHPKYRAIGLGARLVKETLSQVGTPMVGAVAVMAKYNPFFEKAGMKRVALQKPDIECAEALGYLEEMGFNPHLLASEEYNKRRLEHLNKKQENLVKTTLGKIKNQRLRRTVRNKVFVNNNDYQAALTNTDTHKLAKTLRVLSILIQEKAYFFWTTS